MSIRTGLARVAAGEGPTLSGRRVSVLCHPASVDERLRPIAGIVADRGADIASLLGPEHGIEAAAQDMIAVEDTPDITPTYSLYGETFSSLSPRPEMFHGADLLLIDLQDVGARYYTYVWTAVLATEVALRHGLEVAILDRPNPLGGTVIEGGGIESGYDSFVGLHDVATRHAMTLGELVTMAVAERAQDTAPGGLRIVECEGWSREMLWPDTGLPWVLPSPNMPTFDTAVVYPGQCMLEGTNLSEGRGTTRPFELFGAPWVDGEALADALDPALAPGLMWRSVGFLPMFQKHGGTRCGGLQLHVREPAAVRSVATTWALLTALWRLGAGEMAWRTRQYEFVSDRPAIDLLAGGPWLRDAVESGAPPEAWEAATAPSRAAFERRRQGYLLY